MTLVRTGELTPGRFAEVGWPYRLRRRADGGVVALCSTFPFLYWPGRATYEGHALQHRVSLYDGALARRLAIFDGARFPVNDVAFHPGASLAALATGAYDGGDAFEGELVLWNWETGERRSLLGESREVVACRFLDARRLALLLRPRTDSEYETDDPFATYVGVVLDDLAPVPAGDPRLATSTPIDPASLGFFAPAPPRLAPDERRALERLGFEERHRVWDVAWLEPDLVAAVHDTCHLETWRLPGRRELDVRGDGHGVQLLRQPDRWLVHVLEAGDDAAGAWHRSRLLSLAAGGLVERRRFDHACAFTVDRRGRVLARDTGDPMRRRPRTDRVLDPALRTVVEADLGHYDCFNHPVRLDGGDALAFLRGTPPASHQHKRLCAIDAAGAVDERMAWDGPGEHLMNGCAAWCDDGSIVRGYRVYLPHRAAQQQAIERHDLTAARWRHRLDANVTALATTRRHVVFALTSGRLGCLDLATGALVSDEQLAVDGAATMATALAIHDAAVLVGTIDGRLLLYRLAESS